MADLLLSILAAYIVCYFLLAAVHWMPGLVPEHYRERVIGLLHLMIGLALAAKQLVPKG